MAHPGVIRVSVRSSRASIIWVMSSVTRQNRTRLPRLHGETTFERRRSERAPAKLAIARPAAELVKDGQSVYLDAGTTCLEVGRRLLQRRDVRLITHSVPLLAAAADADADAQVIGLVGALRPSSQALVGDIVSDWLDKFHVDLAFLGASGLDCEQGASTTELSEAEVKRHAIARSTRAVLCADHSKADTPSTVHFAAWDAFDQWITDAWPEMWGPRDRFAIPAQLVR